MTTLKANGPEIKRLIQHMATENPRIRYKEICRLTEEASEKLGSGLVAMSIKTLFDARKSEHIKLDRLHALAQVLGVPVEQIVLKDEVTLVPTSPQGITVVMNLPPEIMQTEAIRMLSRLPSQTVQHFLDVVTSLMSTVGTGSIPSKERSRQALIDLANGNLASQLNDLNAEAAFGATRNPEKERRFEQNTRLIIEKAVKYLNSGDVPGQRPDQTFIDYFHEYCQKVSDAETQELWALILAAKIQRPTGFSLRTLRLMQDINRDIAQRFIKLCGIVFIVDGDYLSIRLNETEEYLDWAGLTFDDLLVLADYGLVSLGLRAFEAKRGDHFRYFRRSFQATKTLKFRANPLTAAGRELFKLADRVESDLYFDSVRRMLGDGIGPIQESPVGGNPESLYS